MDIHPYIVTLYARAAMGMGIPMGIPMGIGMGWVWGLRWIPMGLWGFHGDFWVSLYYKKLQITIDEMWLRNNGRQINVT